MPLTRQAKKLVDSESPEPEAEACPGEPIKYMVFHGGRRFNDSTHNPGANKGMGGKISFKWFDRLRLSIIAASFFGFRCMLTMESGLFNRDLNFVHFLPRTISPWIALEYAWGLYPGQINVDSYMNLAIMRTDLHHSFDFAVFLFLPSLGLLKKILSYSTKNSKSVKTKDKQMFLDAFSDKTWSYRFLSISFDKDRSIHRRKATSAIRSDNHTDEANEYERFDYPFDHPDLQNIESHVHPFFVTVNAYIQLLFLPKNEREALLKKEKSLRIVKEIGELWFKKPHETFTQTGKGRANEQLVGRRVSPLADALMTGKKFERLKGVYDRMVQFHDRARDAPRAFGDILAEETDTEDSLIGTKRKRKEVPLNNKRRRTMSTAGNTLSKDVDTGPSSILEEPSASAHIPTEAELVEDLKADLDSLSTSDHFIEMIIAVKDLCQGLAEELGSSRMRKTAVVTKDDLAKMNRQLKGLTKCVTTWRSPATLHSKSRSATRCQSLPPSPTKSSLSVVSPQAKKQLLSRKPISRTTNNTVHPAPTPKPTKVVLDCVLLPSISRHLHMKLEGKPSGWHGNDGGMMQTPNTSGRDLAFPSTSSKVQIRAAAAEKKLSGEYPPFPSFGNSYSSASRNEASSPRSLVGFSQVDQQRIIKAGKRAIVKDMSKKYDFKARGISKVWRMTQSLDETDAILADLCQRNEGSEIDDSDSDVESENKESPRKETGQNSQDHHSQLEGGKDRKKRRTDAASSLMKISPSELTFPKTPIRRTTRSQSLAPDNHNYFDRLPMSNPSRTAVTPRKLNLRTASSSSLFEKVITKEDNGIFHPLPGTRAAAYVASRQRAHSVAPETPTASTRRKLNQLLSPSLSTPSSSKKRTRTAGGSSSTSETTSAFKLNASPLTPHPSSRLQENRRH
ncbi:hypothetical protein VKT23_015807 [Stygiomarasmius scandens]|uniref:HNH nuclease domain-containing protein n=1 Tax=Marasmiellus scandens TaxID=2682957 RepID=A0ABR1J134_9AGAR